MKEENKQLRLQIAARKLSPINNNFSTTSSPQQIICPQQQSSQQQQQHIIQQRPTTTTSTPFMLNNKQDVNNTFDESAVLDLSPQLEVLLSTRMITTYIQLIYLLISISVICCYQNLTQQHQQQQQQHQQQQQPFTPRPRVSVYVRRHNNNNNNNNNIGVKTSSLSSRLRPLRIRMRFFTRQQQHQHHHQQQQQQRGMNGRTLRSFLSNKSQTTQTYVPPHLTMGGHLNSSVVTTPSTTTPLTHSQQCWMMYQTWLRTRLLALERAHHH